MNIQQILVGDKWWILLLDQIILIVALLVREGDYKLNLIVLQISKYVSTVLTSRTTSDSVASINLSCSNSVYL